MNNRKSFRLPGYDYSERNAYFVTICTHNRAHIFGDIAGPPLHAIIDWFKTMTTNEYIRGVKSGLFPAFEKRMWQRNYYEHVIRNEQDLNEIRQYIATNPAKWELDRFYTEA